MSYNANSSDVDYVARVEYLFNNVGYLYIVTPVCLIGFVFNLITFIVFFQPSLNNMSNRCVHVKTLVELILTGISSFSSVAYCTQCTLYRSQFAEICAKYALNFVYRIAYVFQSYCHLMCVYDSYAKFHSPSPVKTAYLVYGGLSVLLSVLISLPDLLSTKIQVELDSSSNLTVFRIRLTEYGQSVWYFYCLLSVSTLFEVVNFVLIVVYTSRFSTSFEKFLENKSRLKFEPRAGNNYTDESHRATMDLVNAIGDNAREIKAFTRKLKIFLAGNCVLFMFTRTIRLSSVLYSQALRAENYPNTPFNIAWNFCTFLFVNLTHSNGFLIYVMFNKIFQKSLLDLVNKVRCKKNRISTT